MESIEAIKDQLYQSLSLIRDSITNSRSLSQSIYEEYYNVYPLLENIGEEFHFLNQQKEKSDIEKDNIYYWNFVWPEIAKNYLLLWRNSLLKVAIAELTELDKNKLERYHQKVFDNLNSSTVDLIYSSALNTNGESHQLQYQDNPWRTYVGQYSIITNQVSEIHRKYDLLKHSPALFYNIANIIKKSISNEQSKLLYFKRILVEIKQIGLNEQIETKLLSTFFLEKEKEIESFYIDHKEYINELELLIAKAPRAMELPVNSDFTQLIVKDIDLKSMVDRWIGSEILPILYEIWEAGDDLENKFKTAIINAKNQSTILQSQEKLEIDLNRLLYPFQQLEKSVQHFEKDYELYRLAIEDRMKLNFDFKNLYNDSPFLKLPGEKAIASDDFLNSPVFNFLISRYKKIKNGIEHHVKKKEIEREMTNGEMVARIMNQRDINTNGHYSNIFLTKGYTAQSFWIRRKDPILRFERAIEDWQNGYLGATLIHGKRYCGKSVFGEMVGIGLKGITKISIVPFKEIEYEGRKHTCTFYLEDTINFLRKHSNGSRILLWIDDLELWRTKDRSVFENYQILQKLISENSYSFFCLVATNTLMWNRLSSHTDFDWFHTVLALDEIAESELISIINIRHGATHYKIMDGQKNEPLSISNQEKIIHHDWVEARGNVGDALNHWVYDMIEKNDNEVIITPKIRQDWNDTLLDSKQLFLLQYIARMKLVSDHELSNYFEANYKSEIYPILLSLLNEKLLVRRADNQIEMNELLDNDIQTVLLRKNK